MTRECTFCGRIFDHLFRCSDCGMLVCDDCSDGWMFSPPGRLTRGAVAHMSSGGAEITGDGYSGANQSCPNCDGRQLISV